MANHQRLATLCASVSVPRTLCAIALGLGLLAADQPAGAQTDADKRTLAELALRWALDGGLADVKLLKDPTVIVVAAMNLPKATELTVPNRKVVLASPLRIQGNADASGDFLYCVIGPFERKPDGVRVPIALRWAVSVKHTGPPYLSGGGAALHFRQQDGQWRLDPVQEVWSS